MPYFHIAVGLRGCYMPDNSYVVRANTRRELKDAIADEAGQAAEAGYVGASKRAIANLAARAWETRGKSTLDHAMPLAPPHDPRSYSYGVFVSAADRAAWENQEGGAQ